MEDIHKYLGEGLFLVYFVVMVVTIIVGRRGQQPPSWLVGVAHGLLAIQVALGVILISSGLGGVPWIHPVIGLAAIAALALTPVFKRRMPGAMGTAALFGLVAVLTLAAQLVARMG
jgi:hypothetical protein